ncbi:MAG: hypothetical protein AAGA56_16110, partial [Myxococcota bacterium]
MRWLRPTSLESPLAVLSVTTVLCGILALGGVYPAVQLGLAGAASLAFAMALGLRHPRSEAIVVPGFSWVMFGLAGWSLLQAIPIPIAWLETIAPPNADVWARSRIPIGETPAFGSISLDPGASLREATRWGSYGGLIAAVACLAAYRRARWVGLAVLGVGTTAAAVT